MDCYPCPCCGYLTRIEKEYGTYDICPVCWWEDDDIQAKHPDHPGGSNDESLNEARENFKKFGACSEFGLKHIRKPLPEEIPLGR
ncbi:CPCC family cysteine-rich protein [Thermoactinomyces sp. DSM 45892]|uniref:CPCC family cysteine-rich protein n=1 Tax=Thermoactinomyces sp. DSM 45892 TaxID=1882753 RepID=UPI000894F2B3|nr:CPCC family cysteine-rich protein [Thermoactinomyces sp. DSM 45892]SDZ27288.1 Cysteine-rich CPCC [Thermoactinomyces sp. DSM 45892]